MKPCIEPIIATLGDIYGATSTLQWEPECTSVLGKGCNNSR